MVGNRNSGRYAAVSLCLSAAAGLACTPEVDSAGALPLQNATARFEQNATDGDVEVVFELTSGDEGLADLTIVGPDGRPVAVFRAPDSSTLGMRTFQFESPEPPNIEGLKAAYPEGTYQFTATTISGASLIGQATLSHELPATAAFIYPAPDDVDVPFDGLEVSWRAVEGVTHYIIEVEQDELEVNLTVRVRSGNTTFAVPSGFLAPGTEYQLTIGTVAGEGNISFVETTFTTAR